MSKAEKTVEVANQETALILDMMLANVRLLLVKGDNKSAKQLVSAAQNLAPTFSLQTEHVIWRPQTSNFSSASPELLQKYREFFSIQDG